MNTERISENYLFQKHTKSEINRWIRTLQYGYYKRAWGGHANDGDEFGIWLKYRNRNELYDILDSLGIQLKPISANCFTPTIGKPYTSVEAKNFNSEIPDYPEYEQPLDVKINSVPCFMWIENGRLSMVFSGTTDGNQYEVGEQDFQNCLQIEKTITNRRLEKYVNRDYENLENYICRNTYSKLLK